jgi:outer membrane receptor protein involved in Fe transport
VKLRASYGNAIKAVAPGWKAALRDLGNNQLANPLLGPERQKGWDAGLELYTGTTASLGVSFYDQTADDLIDQVFIDASTTPIVTQFQNVGQIKNKGWEFEGRLGLGRLRVAGTYTRNTSTVRRLSPTYGGDLQVGDRLLDTPASTSGLQVGYQLTQGTSVAAAMTYIGRRTGMNWLALYDVFFGTSEYTGSDRDYWTQYPAVTKFNLSLSQLVTPQLTGFLQIDNVGNNHRFEQSNVSDPLGRVTTIGLRFQY